ncbi:MAG TPA: hypothetical protein DCY79_13810 [Planctomycetaceae bacterium]|nr:hypothetical protein [Planctomycetaceae bacterium]
MKNFRVEHYELTRRYFLQLGAAGLAAQQLLPLAAAEEKAPLQQAISELEYLTPQDEFQDVSRGNPLPHKLSAEEKTAAGLTRETWRLEIVADPESDSDLRNPLSLEADNALDWDGLMSLAKQRTVAFPKIMTCNNLGCPLGMGIWEGVPLRDAIWLTKPRKNVRRIFYHGFHNHDPQQIFRSSLPIGRVLEDPLGLPPVILCFKLNGEFLNSERGGPVRLVAPEAYGFKSVKWLNRVTLTNLFHANDTYAAKNNDIDSWLKTFAATISIAQELKPEQPIPVTGYAQVGISGLSKVQYLVTPADDDPPADDPYLTQADWQDADILAPPTHWGGDLPSDALLKRTLGFTPQGQPEKWPLRLSKAHWATVVPGLPEGEYTFRCRTVDANGIAQPLPRPFAKSGRNAIEQIDLTVSAV